MSFKTILVHAEPGAGSDRRVRLAMQVAKFFDASIIGLGAEAFDPVFASGYAGVDGVVIEAVHDRIEADLPAAEKHFRELTAGRKGSEWISAEGYPDKMLALHVRGADLIVAGRPTTRFESTTYAAKPAELVMEAGAPVLLAADSDVEFRGDHVVVGWKDTRESRRAVTDALPFLIRAQSVVIVAVCGEANTQIDRVGLQDVARRLARHGVEASVESVPKGKAMVADVLEDVASRHSADLIVSGAYGHARLQEWMMGGVTEDLVASSSKFVLLSH
jgi:nucleotide-binding universal stress UspA family protein